MHFSIPVPIKDVEEGQELPIEKKNVTKQFVNWKHSLGMKKEELRGTAKNTKELLINNNLPKQHQVQVQEHVTFCAT